MHKAGWKFTKVKGFGSYHFEKCEPEDVVYQLDYNKDGLEHKDEYVKMFTDCGWEYLMDYSGYSYFRKSVPENGVAEEIFCYDESKVMMMERVLKGRMLPLLVIFLCVLLPQFIMNVFIYQNNVLATFLGSILAVYIIIFSWCAVKYNKIKNKK